VFIKYTNNNNNRNEKSKKVKTKAAVTVNELCKPLIHTHIHRHTLNTHTRTMLLYKKGDLFNIGQCIPKNKKRDKNFKNFAFDCVCLLRSVRMLCVCMCVLCVLMLFAMPNFHVIFACFFVFAHLLLMRVCV